MLDPADPGPQLRHVKRMGIMANLERDSRRFAATSSRLCADVSQLRAARRISRRAEVDRLTAFSQLLPELAWSTNQ
jgi:hypothetical protein